MSGRHRAPVDPSRSAALVFGVVTAILAIVGLFTVFLLALFDHPYRAVIVLGAGAVLAGNRWLDVIAYLVVGSLLLYLAPWTAAIPPGS